MARQRVRSQCPQPTVEDAKRILRASHYSDVKEHAENMKEEAKKEGWDREQLMDRIHEDADSAVTYTSDAWDILYISDNSDAFQEDPGVVDLTQPNWVEQIAYLAWERDLYEALEQIGVDVNADDLGL